MRVYALHTVCPLGAVTHLPAFVCNLPGSPAAPHFSPVCLSSACFPVHSRPITIHAKRLERCAKQPGQRIRPGDHSISTKQRRGPADRLFNPTAAKHCTSLPCAPNTVRGTVWICFFQNHYYAWQSCVKRKRSRSEIGEVLVGDPAVLLRNRS